MKRKLYIFFICCTFIIGIIASSCRERYIPRPRGYYRIAIPEAKYELWEGKWDEANRMFYEYPYAFCGSSNAEYVYRTAPNEKYWLDIVYPAFNARIHCTYYPVKNNLRELSDDAQNFVYKHAGKASAIPEQGYANEEARVYGVFFELVGNTASPYQFYLTDSTRHFFRGAVYFNCTPNQDSLAPVINYLQQDVRYLIETFRWQ